MEYGLTPKRPPHSQTQSPSINHQSRLRSGDHESNDVDPSIQTSGEMHDHHAMSSMEQSVRGLHEQDPPQSGYTVTIRVLPCWVYLSEDFFFTRGLFRVTVLDTHWPSAFPLSVAGRVYVKRSTCIASNLAYRRGAFASVLVLTNSIVAEACYHNSVGQREKNWSKVMSKKPFFNPSTN